VVERYRSQSHSLNDFTIEHILPDSEGIENAQIGNLIPLEERLNSRCARMGINKKLEIYCESGFASARGTAQRYKDKDFNPAERTKFLAKLIYNNILELNQYDYSKD